MKLKKQSEILREILDAPITPEEQERWDKRSRFTAQPVGHYPMVIREIAQGMIARHQALRKAWLAAEAEYGRIKLELTSLKVWQVVKKKEIEARLKLAIRTMFLASSAFIEDCAEIPRI